jgi:N-acetylmuramoyl-L-alanine amidase
MSVYDVTSDHLLTEDGVKLPFVSNSKSKVSSGTNTVDFVIMHFTGGVSGVGANNWYKDPSSEVSWHLTLDRDGKLYQLLDFRKIAWHAGASTWKTKSGKSYPRMNPVSVGIEMANAGPLTQVSAGTFKTAFGDIIPASDVFIDSTGKPWHKFTDIQLAKAPLIALAIAKRYKCIDILGHNEISPGRKVDPGPAFLPTLTAMRASLRAADWYTHKGE